MDALVTGGAGFIGSNLVIALVEQGHDVTVLDDCFLGTPDNLEPVRDDIDFVTGDVRDAETVQDCCTGIDVAFHDAARSSAPMHVEDAVTGADVNINGFLNVMEAARENGFRVVYATTSSMYGSVPAPHKEHMGERPVNLYSASKMARELYAHVYAENYGVPVVGLRYFSVYGPREQAKGEYANLVSQFLWEMLDGGSPVIYGDGTQSRDFTFVEDIVAGNLNAAAADVTDEIINLGTGTDHTLNELVDMLNAALGTSIEPEYTDNPIDNYPRKTQADNTKAKELLDWRPEHDLETGIEKTAAFYREQR